MRNLDNAKTIGAKMKYLSLFSGIGGFELGLENSKYEFECIGFSEINDYAKAIYTRWFPRHRDLGDASEIDPKELQDFELLVGGFPCQAFSLAGKRQGFDDTRGTLFFEIARICAEKQPKYLLLENVKGLLSHDGGRTFKKILGVLSELGYDVEWQIFNSKSFGTAQNRERLFIKGYFRDKCGSEILSVKRSNREIGVSQRKGLKPVKFNRQVKKRVHDADYGELSIFLKDAKNAANISIREISEKLGKPKSEVEHWFRTDKFFAPPTEDIWFDLKQMLSINDDKYDAFLTEFEWVDGVFEMDKRAYDENGLAPTVTTTDTLAKINVVGNLSDSGHRGGDVFDGDGITRSLTATNYKHPLKVAEPQIKKVGSTNGHQSGDVFDVDGVSPTLCGMEKAKSIVKIKEDPFSVEKVYGSTQKHRAETDGSYCPTLTEAMGKGGGHIPMMKLKTNTKKGYDEVTAGDGVRVCHPTSKLARGRTQKNATGSLSTACDWGTVDKDFRIRRLTPRECERLQAFPDDWTRYGADGNEISDTQRYTCLGNAVTTTVVTWIINNNFFGEESESQRTD